MTQPATKVPQKAGAVASPVTAPKAKVVTTVAATATKTKAPNSLPQPATGTGGKR